MEEDSNIEKVVQELSKEWRKAEVSSVTPLPYDLSPRRYYRISYRDELIPSALLMKLADGVSPLGGGPNDLTQSDCFVELQKYFHSVDIRVPDIYLDARKHGYLLIEDFGSDELYKAISEIKERGFDPLTDDIDNPDKILDLGKKGLDLLLKLQELQTDDQTVAFLREPTFEKLRAGGDEFIEYALAPYELTKQELIVFRNGFDDLSEEVLAHPKVLSHYDFMTHNLHLLSDGEVGMIDFQDAALESPARDLHAFLRDRDMDQTFGVERVRELYAYFKERTPFGDILDRIYPEYQLLWDTRVAGRFTKLADKDGREKYREWISGTFHRAVRGFEKLSQKFDKLSDCLEILENRYPETEQALGDKWL